MPENADKPLLRIAVVGHLDHGKSTLIGRLCHELNAVPGGMDADLGDDWAFYLDQLREEREQLMTLDTTQSLIETKHGRFVFIDVPGHQELIHNMLTGATQAGAAILVLAADEGVQDQTRRHALLLSLLGINTVIVAVNKMDLVDYREKTFRELAGAVAGSLAQAEISPVGMVPVVAQAGDNLIEHSARMPWYKEKTLLELLHELEPPAAGLDAVRFPVQDIYKVNGESVVVGRLLSGTISEGDGLVLCPAREPATVAEICRFPTDHQPGVAGESLGLVLDGVQAERGDVLAYPDNLPVITDRFQARVFWLAEEPLAAGDELTFRCATQKLPVAIESIQERLDTATLESLPPGAPLAHLELGTITIHASEPLVIEPFSRIPGLGRFILERHGHPLAAGIVL